MLATVVSGTLFIGTLALAWFARTERSEVAFRQDSPNQGPTVSERGRSTTIRYIPAFCAFLGTCLTAMSHFGSDGAVVVGAIIAAPFVVIAALVFLLLVALALAGFGGMARDERFAEGTLSYESVVRAGDAQHIAIRVELDAPLHHDLDKAEAAEAELASRGTPIFLLFHPDLELRAAVTGAGANVAPRELQRIPTRGRVGECGWDVVFEAPGNKKINLQFFQYDDDVLMDESKVHSFPVRVTYPTWNLAMVALAALASIFGLLNFLHTFS